uniref:Uncharacterized protein n=1 Tax=Anabas testudineus TaxID=64144 RepID=A0A7N6BFY7_ANATE
SSQELVHRHMDLRGEVHGECDGQDHKKVVSQNLWGKNNTLHIQNYELSPPDSSILLCYKIKSGAQVLPVGEIGLGLWVHHQHPSACSHVYLARASAPMSSAFPDTLAQKALTVFLSLALRLVI